MKPVGESLETELQVEPVLSCREVYRRLGEGEAGVAALRGVSLELFPAETCAIMGPSGCGKSTLLYVLGLLDRVDGGAIFLDGAEVSGIDEKERTRLRLGRIGFVFQFHFLLTEFTVLENVMIPMQRLGKFSKKENRARAVSLLEKVGLGGKLERRANRLSGGEQQRVAVARAFANSPAVVLADEPTGNLDEVNAGLVVDLLREVAKEDECAVLVVTHNPVIGKQLDRRLTMRDGRIVESME